MTMQDNQGSHHLTPFSGRIRLIFTDIDGTFVNEDKEISPEVRDAARETVRRGIPLAFATGRMYKAIEPWIRTLGFTGLQIVSNGGEIVRPRDGSYAFHLAFTPAQTEWLSEFGRRNGYVPLLFTRDAMLASGPFDGEEILLRNREYPVYKSIAEMNTLPCEKIVFIATGERIPALEALAETMQTMPRPDGMAFTAVFSERGILNIIPEGAGKLQAIRRICDLSGCTLADVMAMGDGDNDAEMLAGVGCGVAMGNATPKARDAANFIVPDNRHHGAAHALRFAWEHAR